MKKNTKGVTLVELLISITLIILLSLGIALTINSLNVIKAISKNNLELENIHNNIIYNYENQKIILSKKIPKGSGNYEMLLKTEFLKLFPNYNNSQKNCYFIDNENDILLGSNNIIKTTINNDGIVNGVDEYSINTNLKSQKYIDDGDFFKTSICLSEGFNKIDILENNKNGPLLMTIHSNYFLNNKYYPYNSEKIFYFY